MARLESTPARPIVSKSCSAAGHSADSTMEWTGMFASREANKALQVYTKSAARNSHEPRSSDEPGTDKTHAARGTFGARLFLNATDPRARGVSGALRRHGVSATRVSGAASGRAADRSGTPRRRGPRGRVPQTRG